MKFGKIGRPAERALNNEGITTLEQLAEYTEQELLQLHGVGPKAIRILKEKMEIHNLSFKDEGKEHK